MNERRSTPHSMRRAPFLLLLLLALGLGFLLGRSGGPATAPPGKHEGHEHAETEQATSWTCSMHPQIQLPEPGKCPICGMDLIPVGGDSTEKLADNQVALSERAKTLAWIETAPVRRGDTAVELRLLGRLEVDETKANGFVK